jgi:hypothetical protein
MLKEINLSNEFNHLMKIIKRSLVLGIQEFDNTRVKWKSSLVNNGY